MEHVTLPPSADRLPVGGCDATLPTLHGGAVGWGGAAAAPPDAWQGVCTLQLHVDSPLGTCAAVAAAAAAATTAAAAAAAVAIASSCRVRRRQRRRRRPGLINYLDRSNKGL